MKIIHTSDIHLASPLTSKLSAEKAKKRASELREAFFSICSGARSVGAEAVIIAGDLFDSESITHREIDSFLSSVLACPEITFFYLGGNHEQDVLMTAPSLPDNLKIFGDEWTYYHFGDITFAGRRSLSRDMYDSLTLSEADKNIVVLHGELREYSQDGAIALSELRGKNIDYLALGHYHSYKKAEIDRRGIAVYCGCPEGRGFDEVGPKGIVLIDTDCPANARFYGIAKRTLHIVKVEVEGAESTYALEEKILEATGSYSKNDLIRVSLTGSRSIESSWDTGLICKRLEDKFFYFEIKDETKLATKTEDYKYDKTLKGEFIRLCLSKEDLSDEEKEAIINCGILALAGEDFE